MNTQFRILKKNKICKFLYLGIKIKMNNQVFIPSHGIGEMYLDVSDMFGITMNQLCLILIQKHLL